jgi:hypothetical protein
MVAWTISIMVLSIEDSKDKNFWLAFLTTWAFLFALWYLLSSFVSVAFLSSSRAATAAAAAKPTVIPTRDDEESVNRNDDPNHEHRNSSSSSNNNNDNIDNNNHDINNDQHNTGDANHTTNTAASMIDQGMTTLWTKIMWVLYVIAIHSQVVVTLLYWLLVYDGSSVDHTDVYRHGILMILIMMDGFVINRIPIRLKQIVFVYAYSFAYLVWSLIHFAADIGNPETMDNDPDTNDDALYGVLSWRDNPGGAAILCLILFFVGIPLIFVFVWALSLWVPHRYIIMNR